MFVVLILLTTDTEINAKVHDIRIQTVRTNTEDFTVNAVFQFSATYIKL